MLVAQAAAEALHAPEFTKLIIINGQLIGVLKHEIVRNYRNPCSVLNVIVRMYGKYQVRVLVPGVLVKSYSNTRTSTEYSNTRTLVLINTRT